MKKIFLSAALSAAIIAAGIPALAQTATDSQSGTSDATSQNTPMKGRRGLHHGDGFNNLSQKLNLTQQQQDQLKPVFQKQHEQVQAIRKDSSLTEDQKKQKIAALRQDTQAQINNVLTPEQQQQWEQMKANAKQRAGNRHEQMGARMAEKLNLSAQQQEQLKPIWQKQREQAKAIWQDNSLTQDQKREKMKALHQDTQSQVNAILTPEQQQQLQQMRQNSRQHRHGSGPATESQQTPQGA